MATYFEQAIIHRLQEIFSRVSGESERKEALQLLNSLIKVFNERSLKA